MFGAANPDAEAGAATNVEVDVFEPLNGDILKPDRLIERLKESSMASTWIMALLTAQHMATTRDFVSFLRHEINLPEKIKLKSILVIFTKHSSLNKINILLYNPKIVQFDEIFFSTIRIKTEEGKTRGY